MGKLSIMCTMIPFINMITEKPSVVEMTAIAVWGVVFFAVAMVEIISTGKQINN